MKFCQKCGKEIMDEAVICPGCGCKIAGSDNSIILSNGLNMAILVFLIITCVFLGIWIIPLAWCLPITVIIYNKLKNDEPISTALKVCTLLFVSLIAGILLFLRSEKRA